MTKRIAPLRRPTARAASLFALAAASALAPALRAQEAAEQTEGKLATTTLVSTRTERAALQSPATVVSIDLADDTADQTADVGAVVSRTPDVSIPFDFRGVDTLVPYKNGGYQSFNIRGIDGNRVLLEIDGIRQVPEYNEYLGGGSGGTTRAMFDPKVFESVDILKGSASALYGSDALGGVIALKTLSLVDYLETSERPWYLATSVGYYGVNDGFNQVVKAGARTGDFYATVVNSYRTSGEQQNDKGTEAYPEDNDSNHLLANFAYLPSKAHRFSLVAERYTSSSETDMTGMSYSMAMGTRTYQIVYGDLATSSAEIERERVSLKYENRPSDGLWDSLTAHLYYQSSESDIVTRTIGTVGYVGYTQSVRNRQDVMTFDHDTLGLNLLATKKYTTGPLAHTTIAGLDLSSEDAKNTFLRYDTATSGTVTTTDKMAMDPSTVNRADLFAQDEIEWGRWLLVAGLRYSHYEIRPDNDEDYLAANSSVGESADYTNDTLTPSASLVYKLTGDSVLWGRYAMGIKNPTSENYTGSFSHSGGSDPFIILANPDLDPETSNAFELGYRRHAGFFKFEASAHKTFYTDFIDSSVLVEDNVAPEADVYSHANIGKVEIWGAETSFALDLKVLGGAFDGFTFKTTAAWNDGKNKSDDLWLATVSPFTVVNTLAYRSADKWGASLTGTWRAKKSHAAAIADQGYYIPDASFVTDAYAWYKLTRQITVRAGVNNLTNERYWVWANISRGGHTGTVTERNVQPGANAYAAIDFVF